MLTILWLIIAFLIAYYSDIEFRINGKVINNIFIKWFAIGFILPIVLILCLSLWMIVIPLFVIGIIVYVVKKLN